MSKNIYALINTYFVAKISNHHLNLQQAIIFLLMEGLAWMFMTAD